MEVLNILKEKLAALVVIMNKLKEENRQLHSDNEALKVEQVRLAHDNAQLIDRLMTVEQTIAQGSMELDDLHREKKLTKSAVDDLIKNIESLVEEDQL